MIKQSKLEVSKPEGLHNQVTKIQELQNWTW